MKRMQKEAERKQLEEEESLYPAEQEDNPNWMWTTPLLHDVALCGIAN